MACGPSTFAVAAEKSVITWGAATNQELGYGEGGKKSSANPAKVGLSCALCAELCVLCCAGLYSTMLGWAGLGCAVLWL